MPIGWIVGAGVVSSLIGANASQSAADTQAQAANNASANTMAMFQQQQQNVAPWLKAGQGALSAEQSFMGIDPT